MLKNIKFAESNYDIKDRQLIDFKIIFKKLISTIPRSIGLSLLGLVLSILIFLIYYDFSNISTSTRVVFSFKGYNNGLYPDKSKFSYQDLIAPDIIHTAVLNCNLDLSESYQNKITQSISIEGLLTSDQVKLRDRLISTGQSVSTLIPDEYILTIVLPRNFNLTIEQRKHLLLSIVNSFKTKFEKAYAISPITLGNLTAALQSADYDDFELILADNSNRIESYLNNLIKDASTFRSRRTKLTFADLLNENQDFNQVYKNKTLGFIHEGNLARDRKAALIKMDYQLYELLNLEKQEIEEEKTTREYLNDANIHSSNYILAVKSQIMDQHTSNAPLLDKSLIDSLINNDTYSFFIKKALEVSLKLKSTQVQKIIVSEKRARMELALKADSKIDQELINKASQSMSELVNTYSKLINDIQVTYSEYASQEFSDAIRLTAPIESESIWKALLIPAIVGLCLGGFVGIGLSLLEISPSTENFK
jgi:hypothetical protein